jgi:hypothetical protein
VTPVVHWVFSFGPAQPNPATTSTRLPFVLSDAAGCELVVFAPSMQPIRHLYSGHRPAGAISLSWDCCDDRGGRVAAGIYGVRLRAGGRECWGDVEVLP